MNALPIVLTLVLTLLALPLRALGNEAGRVGGRAAAQDGSAEPNPDGGGEVPARLDPADLAGLDKLSPNRRKLVENALRVGRENRLSRYLFGSADPARGGFDCSGSVYYLLRGIGLAPPRSSSAQFDWLKDAGTLVPVPEDTRSLDGEVFARLRPGDLLFWTGTYQPKDGRTNGITHVQIYLGREAKDGRPVMIGSSDGRSYRGRKQCGYGVYDFRLPRPGSRARFAGFGTPPGLEPEGG